MQLVGRSGTSEAQAMGILAVRQLEVAHGQARFGDPHMQYPTR